MSDVRNQCQHVYLRFDPVAGVMLTEGILQISPGGTCWKLEHLRRKQREEMKKQTPWSLTKLLMLAQIGFALMEPN